MKTTKAIFLAALLGIIQSKDVELGNECVDADKCVVDGSGNPTKCCNLYSNESLKMYIAGDSSHFTTLSDKKLCVDPTKDKVTNKGDNKEYTFKCFKPVVAGANYGLSLS